MTTTTAAATAPIGAAVSTGAGVRVSGAEIESTGRSPVTAQRTHGPAVLPDAESLQLVHGAGGSLSDAAGQPLGTALAGR